MPDGRQFLDRVCVATACGFGVGAVPGAPGTYGSLLAAVPAWFLVSRWGTPGLSVAAAGALLVGLLTAGRAARRLGSGDPGSVVIDEIAGQWVALLALPHTLTAWILAFVLFRAFDVLKPFPSRRLEALPGSSGIMADDLMAGLYANVVARLVLLLI